MRLIANTLALTLPLLLGCGSGNLSVSGQVSYDGKPLDSGLITFVPTSKEGSAVDAEIESGGYAISGDAGLLTGSYKVWIDAERPTGRRYPADEGSNELIEEVVNYIPEEYNTATTLQVDLQENQSDLDFNLEAVRAHPSR